MLNPQCLLCLVKGTLPEQCLKVRVERVWGEVRQDGGPPGEYNCWGFQFQSLKKHGSQF